MGIAVPGKILHKLTTQLVRENQTIVVEDLAIKNMVEKTMSWL